jgi:hypothetical protein
LGATSIPESDALNPAGSEMPNDLTPFNSAFVGTKPYFSSGKASTTSTIRFSTLDTAALTTLAMVAA